MAIFSDSLTSVVNKYFNNPDSLTHTPAEDIQMKNKPVSWSY